MIEKETKELFPGDQAQRCKRLETNCKFLFSQIEKIHTAICPTEIGTWQERTEQAVRKAQRLPELRKGLERLKNSRNWQSVEEVDTFIDKLLAICENE